MNPTSATDLALYYWSIESLRLPVGLIAAGCLLAVLFGRHQATVPKRTFIPRKPPRRWHWPFTRKRIPWKLGPVTVDMKGGQHTLHAILAGTTRSGKSSAVLPLVVLPGPFVAVGFDVSKPLEEWWEAHDGDPDYIHWKMDGTLGWNILDGPDLSVSEGLTAGFARSAGDRGIYRGHVSTRLLRLIRVDDAAGRRRDLRRYVVELRERTGDRESDEACKAWASRFDGLLERFGPAFGDDFSIASAVKQGKKVLALPNRFLHPESAMLIGGIGLVQSRRVAGEVGKFIQFIEEAGQASYYTEEINASFQAGGTRECPTILATQNLSTLKREITNNARIWVVFNQQIEAEAKIGAEQLRLDDHFKLFDLPTGDAWVRGPDVGPTLVHVKLPKLRKAAPPSYVSVPTPTYEKGPTARRTVVREIGQVTYAALPPPSLKVRKILDKIDRTQGDCWLWMGTIDDDGYGVQYWQYPDDRKPNNRPAHQVVWELTNGRWFPMYEDGSFWDWDHRRTCQRHCVNPGHGEPTTRGENSRRRWRVRGVART